MDFWRGTGRIFSLVGQVKRRERGRALKVKTWSSGSLCLNALSEDETCFSGKREMQPQGYQEEGCNFYWYLGCATCGHTSWAWTWRLFVWRTQRIIQVRENIKVLYGFLFQVQNQSVQHTAITKNVFMKQMQWEGAMAALVKYSQDNFLNKSIFSC